MRSVLKKTVRREIRLSLGRYIAIMAIIALGAGFFAGLRIARPMMVRTADDYLERLRFFDYRLLTTLGFDRADPAKAAQVDGVAAAEGAVYADILYTSPSGAENVLRVHSITSEVNALDIVAGRMPERADECVLDAYVFGSGAVGSVITLSPNNSEDTLDMFSCGSFTVVGVARSPLYLNYERGNTSIGTGSIQGFMFIPLSGFDVDHFTEIYIRLEERAQIYSDEYKRISASMEDALTAEVEMLADMRYNSVISDAQAQIADGRAELDTARCELEDARRELEDGQAELERGRAEYADALAEYEKAEAEAEAELADAYDELVAAEAEIADGQAELDEGYAGLVSGADELADGWQEYCEQRDKVNAQLRDALSEVVDAQRELDEGSAELAAGRAQARSGLAQVDAGLASCRQGMEQLEQLLQLSDAALGYMGLDRPALEAQRSALEQTQAELTANKALLEAALRETDSHQAEIDEGYDALDEGFLAVEANRMIADMELEKAYAELMDYRQELLDGWAEYGEGVRELERGRQELSDGWQDYMSGKAEAETQLADARQELTDAAREIEDGQAELDGYRQDIDDAQAEIDEAQAKIDEAQADVDDIRYPSAYALDRDTNVGYACFESDSSIVEAISRVFPIFFFLIAALVCSTTMTRMIDEQRTQIGVFKALGYGDAAILGKYTAYSGSAALVGCAAGYAGGTLGFPAVIWMAYGIMYGFADLIYVFDGLLLAVAIAASLLCSVGATYLACRRELGNIPASLMRPKAPKAGRRILLERIAPLWRRMSFLHKVTARNILRYKKRMFMMMLGIGGCMALLLTGLGLNDSISNIANFQYAEIDLYDISVTFTDGQDGAAQESFAAGLAEGARDCLLVHSAQYDVSSDTRTKPATVIASDGGLGGYISLHRGAQAVAWPGAGEAVLSKKLAETLGVGVGGTVSVRSDELGNMALTVSGICDNYVGHRVYVDAQSCVGAWGEMPPVKTAYISAAEGCDLHAAAAAIMDGEGVADVSVTADFRARIDKMMDSLNMIVVAVILSAGALAFIVLYNLTNINITERVREIATLKVLGFKPSESASYVFRENMALTALGAVVGIPMGIGLHAFVMAQINIDMISFDNRIAPLSFFIAAALTLVFTLAVNFVMYFRINGINMAESLKSAE